MVWPTTWGGVAIAENVRPTPGTGQRSGIGSGQMAGRLRLRRSGRGTDREAPFNRHVVPIHVHPSEDRVLDAIDLLGGHKTGHTVESEVREETKQLQEGNDNTSA